MIPLRAPSPTSTEKLPARQSHVAVLAPLTFATIKTHAVGHGAKIDVLRPRSDPISAYASGKRFLQTSQMVWAGSNSRNVMTDSKKYSFLRHRCDWISALSSRVVSGAPSVSESRLLYVSVSRSRMGFFEAEWVI